MGKLRIPSLPHQPCVLCCHLGQRVKLDVQQHSLANGLLGDKCDHRRQRREKSVPEEFVPDLERTERFARQAAEAHGVREQAFTVETSIGSKTWWRGSIDTLLRRCFFHSLLSAACVGMDGWT